jgi:hypothetical protein
MLASATISLLQEVKMPQKQSRQLRREFKRLKAHIRLGIVTEPEMTRIRQIDDILTGTVIGWRRNFVD